MIVKRRNYPRAIADIARLKHIGSGGYGSVYSLSKRRVAKMTCDEREIRTALWQLEAKHPQLVRVYEVTLLPKAHPWEHQKAIIIRERAENAKNAAAQVEIANRLTRDLNSQSMRPYDVRPPNVGVALRRGKFTPVVRDLGACQPPRTY